MSLEIYSSIKIDLTQYSMQIIFIHIARIRCPENPSRRHLQDVLERLLNIDTMFNALL